MSFLASIEKHDLDIKKKQLAQWIEKKYHVRITVINSRVADGPAKGVSLISVGGCPLYGQSTEYHFIHIGGIVYSAMNEVQ